MEQLADVGQVKALGLEHLGQRERAERQMLVHHVAVAENTRRQRAQAGQKRSSRRIAADGLNIRRVEAHRRAGEAVDVRRLADRVAVAAPDARVAVFDVDQQNVHPRRVGEAVGVGCGGHGGQQYEQRSMHYLTPSS